MLFDLKVIKSVLDQLEEERGIPKEKVLEAVAMALATAYKKEYGKKGQIVRATFDPDNGKTEFFQVKAVVDREKVIMEDEEETDDDAEKIRFNPEHHILLDDAQKIKTDAKVDDELTFPLEEKGDYGRIAAQTAKQVIIQKIREAEKVSVMEEYGKREGDIVSGTVQRVERGNLFVDMGRTNAILPYEEQIPGERYKQGERIRAYLYKVEETPRGIFLKLSRSHPKFLEKLFAMETPEIASGVVEIKSVAREAGSRSKVAVVSHDSHVDPVGSLVGQRGVRVSTVMSELGGEKIDIIEWSPNTKQFIEDALSPARVLSVEITSEEEKHARVDVAADQQSLAIGRGGQNVRLAAKLTGWRIDIQSSGTPEGAEEKAEAEIKTENPKEEDGIIKKGDKTERPAEEIKKPPEEKETPEETKETE